MFAISKPLKCKSFVVRVLYVCDPVCYLSNGFHLEICITHIGITNILLNRSMHTVQSVENELHGHKTRERATECPSKMQNIDCVHRE